MKSNQPRFFKSLEPRKKALAEVLLLWAVAFAAIAITLSLGPYSKYAKAVAAFAFLYLPGMVVWPRNEDYRDYGATLKNWKKDVLLGLAVSLVILPLFALGYAGFIELLKNIPKLLSGILIPYHYPSGSFSFRLPDEFPEYIIDQFLVVALPEEFFYRGFIQSRLEAAWPGPGGKMFWGCRLGKAFLVTQVLFALGHLAEPNPGRLAVFFPSLIFGLLRAKSGTIIPGTIFHALSNLTIRVLEISYGLI